MLECESICKNIREILVNEKSIITWVDSIFDNVVNLQTKEHGIITCTKRREVLVPYGILLNNEFCPKNYEIGQKIYLSDKNETNTDSIFININSVNIVDLQLYKCSKNINISELKRILSIFLKNNNLNYCIGEILSRIESLYLEKLHLNYSVDIVENILPLFEKFIEKVKDNKNLKEYNNILGFGVGMTPSSDDFILGMLSVFCFFNNDRSNILKEYIGENLHTTTKISFNMLSNALKDNFPSYIIDFYSQISVDLSCLENILNVFANHGHSSGIDTLYGIYVGLSCLY